MAAACSSSQPQLHAITGSSPTGATDVSAKHECMQVSLVTQSMQWKSIFICERRTRFWVGNNHSLTTCVRTYSIVNIIYTLCTSGKNCVSFLCSEYQINKRCMVLLPEMGGQTSTITTANAYTKTTCSWDSGLRTEQWSSSVRTFYVHDNYATSVWIFSISLPMQLPSTKINLPVAVSTVYSLQLSILQRLYYWRLITMIIASTGTRIYKYVSIYLIARMRVRRN